MIDIYELTFIIILTQEIYAENKLQQDSDGVWKAENRIYKEDSKIL